MEVEKKRKMSSEKKQRGGPGRNQGRKAKPDGGKAVTVSVSLTAENAAWLAAQDGPKSHIVNQALDSVRASQNQPKMERRKEQSGKVTFDLVVEDPNTGNEIARYKSEGNCQPEDYDAVNRIAQAQEGTLFAHAENPVWQ